MLRTILAAAALGALAGALFALAVVSFADCAGPHCARERVLGVAGHAAAGAAAGALVGWVVAIVRQAWHARRAGARRR